MKYVSLAALSVAVALGGCATQGQPGPTSADAQLQQQLDQARSAQSQLQSENASLKQQLGAAQHSPAGPSESTGAPSTVGDTIDLVPPNAKPGECFARVMTPAKFQTKTKSVLKSAASQRIVTTPAQFGWDTKRILVKPESTKIVAVPATYKMIETRELVSPAHNVWKRSDGAMCLVAVPAKYHDVKSRVVDQAVHTKTVTIPAVYKTIKVRTLVKPAGTRSIDIPARYQTVSRTVQVKDPTMIWSRVVCHSNATSDLIREVQTALKKKGFHPGPIDGLLGPQTLSGTRAYENANGLAQSKAKVITYETLKTLGIDTP